MADGLGGHDRGEVASRCAVNAALTAFGECPRTQPEQIAQVMDAANRAVRERQGDDHGYHSMKTTLVAMFYRRGQVAFAHVGDSRLYLFRNKRIVFQTRDHTLSQMQAEAGNLPEEDVRFHDGRNRLLRALGATDAVRADVTDAIRLRRGDAVLLCTDGFWENVLEQCMEDTLSIAASPAQWLELMRFHHQKVCTQRQDNFTAMAVFAK